MYCVFVLLSFVRCYRPNTSAVACVPFKRVWRVFLKFLFDHTKRVKILLCLNKLMNKYNNLHVLPSLRALCLNTVRVRARVVFWTGIVFKARKIPTPCRFIGRPGNWGLFSQRKPTTILHVSARRRVPVTCAACGSRVRVFPLLWRAAAVALCDGRRGGGLKRWWRVHTHRRRWR